MVGISKDGKITGVEIGNHSETPGLGSKATEPMFKNQYVDKDVLNSLLVVKGSTNNDNEISAISGATITSNGVTNGVNAAMKIYNEKLSGNDNEMAYDENIDPKEKIFKSVSFTELKGKAEGEVLRVYEATFDTGLKKQFENIKAQEVELVLEARKKENDIQVVSGATISSKSIVNAVNAAVNLSHKMEG